VAQVVPSIVNAGHGAICLEGRGPLGQLDGGSSAVSCLREQELEGKAVWPLHQRKSKVSSKRHILAANSCWIPVVEICQWCLALVRL
jgi:hypothetical protein